MNFKIRLLTHEDIQRILEIQELCYPSEYLEDYHVFQTIMVAFPEGALGLWHDKQLQAYFMFHPFYQNKVKPLNSELSITGQEDCIYFHDLAVIPSFQHQKAAHHLVDYAIEWAMNHHYFHISLVAIEKAIGFWKSLGYTQSRKIDYGNKPAYFMERSLNQ